jgi:small-conductance mechanosensitive channel
VDIGNSVQQGFNTFFAFLPSLLGFLVLLLVGFIVAKIVASIVRKVLEKAGIDRRLSETDASRYTDHFMPGASVANGISRIIFWLIFIFFVFAAIGALQIPAVTGFMNQVLAYLPNVIAAIVIFVVAALVSAAVGAAVTRVMGDTATGKVVAGVVPAVVMVIAFFMILEQLQIAPEIVRIAFAAVMFALALGLALAFGLGGRGVAERMLEDAYRKGREQREQVKSDLQTGRDRAQDEAQRADPTRPDSTTTGSTTAGSTTTASYPMVDPATDPGTDPRY